MFVCLHSFSISLVSYCSKSLTRSTGTSRVHNLSEYVQRSGYDSRCSPGPFVFSFHPFQHIITRAVLRAYIHEVQHDDFIKGSESDARQHTRVHTMSTPTILMIYM